MALVLAATALGVDVGAAAFEKRDLQKIVDLAALDAVRAVGDLRPGAADAETVAERADRLARESASRNGFDPDLDGRSMSVELGVADPDTRVFAPLAPAADEAAANAVLVFAEDRYQYRFMPGASELAAEGVAVNEATATIGIGTRAAQASTIGANPLLTGAVLDALGLGDAELELISYQGLTLADVALGDVWSNLGLGTTDEILDGQVTLTQLAGATIQALDNQGSGIDLAGAGALQTLLDAAGGAYDPTLTFTFGELLDIGTNTPGSAAYARIGVMDLLVGAAQIANGDNLLSLDLPVAQVPGVASGTVAFSLIEKPRYAVGPARLGADGLWVTRARTAQARLEVTLRLLTGVSYLGVVYPIDLPLYAESAAGEASLTAIACSAEAASPESVPVTVAAATTTVSAAVGTVGDQALTNPAVSPAPSPATLASILSTIKVTGTAGATVPGSSETIGFAGPFVREHRMGGLGVDLGSRLLSSLQLSVSGVSLLLGNSLKSSVASAVSPVLGAVDGALLEPLAATLGVSLAGADVWNTGLTCAGRRLIG